MFEDPRAAALALRVLTAQGTEASFARESLRTPSFPPSCEDPTNLYFSGLPVDVSEAELEKMLLPFVCVSSRILRNATGASRGVGFARMNSRKVCAQIIGRLNDTRLPHSTEPLVCKFADNPTQFRAVPRSRQPQPFTPAVHTAYHAGLIGHVPRDGRGQLLLPVAGIRPPLHASARLIPSQPHLDVNLHNIPQHMGPYNPEYRLSPIPPMAGDPGMLGFLPQQGPQQGRYGVPQPGGYYFTPAFPPPATFYNAGVPVTGASPTHPALSVDETRMQLPT